MIGVFVVADELMSGPAAEAGSFRVHAACVRRPSLALADAIAKRLK
jgi:hypothetical protein